MSDLGLQSPKHIATSEGLSEVALWLDAYKANKPAGVTNIVSLIVTIGTLIGWLVTASPYLIGGTGFSLLIFVLSLVLLFVDKTSRSRELILDLSGEITNGVVTSNGGDRSLGHKPPDPLISPHLKLAFRTISGVVVGQQELVFDEALEGEEPVTIYAIEFRHIPTVHSSGSVDLEVSLRIDGKPFEKAYWLRTWRPETQLSVGESDMVVLAVERGGRYWQYKIARRGDDRVPYGVYVPESSNVAFVFEFVCKQNGKVVQTETVDMRLFGPSDKRYFYFAFESVINKGHPLFEPLNPKRKI